ncbi:hypothetical protein QTP88_012999 [Uroleucon formosanum]
MARVNSDEGPSFENYNAENSSIPANDNGKEKESVDMDLEKNESPEDVVKLVASLPCANGDNDEWPSFENCNADNSSIKANDDGKEKNSADIDLEKNESPEDLVESVASLPYGKYTCSFHEEHYFKKMASGQFVKRIWVSYSPSTDRVYCIVCKLFGTTECKRYKLGKSGYYDWKHLAYALKNHEATHDHLQAEIRRQCLNSKVVENREIIKEIIKALLYLSRQNMAFRGHDENTTTDVANLEQFSLIVRFLNEDRDVEERLVASDASGLGMFNLLCDICQHFELDWVNNLCAQSYDGAASMQGCYSGVKTLIKEKNPRAIYVWWFAHILNLFVVDTCDKNTVTRIFFGNLQSLVSFMRARKRTALFIEAQKIYYPNERICKIKNFSNTHWTSHHQVLGVICTKYKAVTKTLKDLSLSLDRETSATAKNLQTVMSSFMFITNLLLMKNVFEYTTPLSLYLQLPSTLCHCIMDYSSSSSDSDWIEEVEETVVATYILNQTVKNRRFWVHPINKERNEKGVFTNLFPQLINDPEKFHQYFRMSYDQFSYLHNLIKDDIKKQNTQFRAPVPPEQRLAVC